jgi:hypothetical protein
MASDAASGPKTDGCTRYNALQPSSVVKDKFLRDSYYALPKTL